MAVTVHFPRTADYGDAVTVSMVFTDDGAAVDPSTVGFSYRPQASGVTTTLVYGTDVELVKDSTGHYHVVLTVTTEGLWDFTATATGTGAGSFTEYFYVNPDPLIGPTVPSIDLPDDSTISSTEPRLLFYETDQTANQKQWDIDVSGGTFAIRTRSDVDGAGVAILSVIRGTGTALHSINVNYGQADADFTIASDANAAHFVSDAGFFNGQGAFGFGDAAASSTFININPPTIFPTATLDFYRAWVRSSAQVVYNSAGTSAIVSSLVVSEPNIALSGGAAVSDAYSLYIEAAPTEGSRNGALWIASGESRFDGAINVGGATPKFTVNTSGAITKLNNVTVPINTYTASNVTTDRTYNADSTSTDELADVLGTLIADLRSVGLVA